MSKKVFNVFSILCFALVLCFIGCTELINPKTETDINLNIDLSKIIKSTRNTGETQSSASIDENPVIKVAIYDAKNFDATSNSTENLTLITQAQASIGGDGIARVKLSDIPVGIYAIVFAELSFSNGNSTEVMYAGKSKVFNVKASDNKISLVLIKVGVDDEDKPDDSNTPYEISSWDELVDLVTKINSLSDVTTTTEFIIMNDLIATCTITVSKPVKITSDKKLIITRDSEFSGEFFHIDTGSLELGSIILDGGNQNDINATYPLISSSGNGLTLTNCTLQNNTLNNINASFGNGGAVYVSGGTFTMNNSSITNCSANENGGAVYVSGGTFTMNDGVTITNCDAKDGGAVYITDGGTFTMKDDASISNCTATNSGGGVWMNNGSSFTMSGGKIDMCNSNSEGGGGGVYVTGEDNPCTFKMLDSATITGCSALNGGGGGVSYGCGPNGTFEISGEAKINNNHSTCGGDGIYLYGKLTMTGGTISSNNDASNGNGVGVYVRNVNDVLSSLSMSGNAIVESYDYVYLESGTTVTVAGDLTADKVARITLFDYTVGTQVLTAENGVTLEKYVGKFALADETYSIGNDGKIASNQLSEISLTQDKLNEKVETNTFGDSYYELEAGEYCVSANLILEYPIQINASGGEVKLYSNANYTISCAEIFNNSANSAMIVLPMSAGTLTLGGGNGTLTIDGTTNSTTKLDYLVMSSGTFNLSDKVTITNGNVNYGAVYIGAGSFTMNGGTITNNNSTKCSGIYTTGNPTTPTTIRINNGTISNNFVNSENKGASIYCYNTNATVNLPDNSTVTSTSDMFTKNIVDGKIQDVATSGGNESLIEGAYYVSATGSDDNDGSCDNPFKTLNKAITSANTSDSKTVYVIGELVGDEAYYSGFYISEDVGTNVSPINIIGYPDEIDDVLTVDAGRRVVYVDSNSYITFKDLTITGGNVDQSGSAMNLIDCTVTLDNVTIKGNYSSNDYTFGSNTYYSDGIEVGSNCTLNIIKSSIENNIRVSGASDSPAKVTIGTECYVSNIYLVSDSSKCTFDSNMKINNVYICSTSANPPVPAIYLSSSLSNYSSDNRIIITYEDCSKVVNNQLISLKDGANFNLADEVKKFTLSDTDYTISDEGIVVKKFGGGYSL